MTEILEQYYADNPVEVLDKNQRVWYDPDVMLLFKTRSMFQGTINYIKSLENVRATTMVVTQILEPHANYNSVAARTMWLPAMHIDSRSIEITFSNYAGKVALHDYDELVTYWKANGTAGLRSIINQVLGAHVVDVHDFLARNAYLQGALNTTGYVMYAGDATTFNDMDEADTFDMALAGEIQLGMQYREVSQAYNVAQGLPGAVICYTTPGVIYDIQEDPDWIDLRKYADPTSILRYEVGTYKNVRFISNPRLTLWNAGAMTFCTALIIAHHAGDGSPNPGATKVDGTYQVGQTSAGIKHFLQCGAALAGSWADSADIAVNDIVTIATSRTTAFGVTDGLNPFDGHLHNRRVVGIDRNAHTIELDQPLMEDFSSDLGGGILFGYVFKGFNVHASIFVGGPQGIVAGVAQPIRFHTPPPIDDLEAIYRYSWNSREGFQPYAPEVFEVVFSAGSVRIKGRAHA